MEKGECQPQQQTEEEKASKVRCSFCPKTFFSDWIDLKNHIFKDHLGVKDSEVNWSFINDVTRLRGEQLCDEKLRANGTVGIPITALRTQPWWLGGRALV